MNHESAVICYAAMSAVRMVCVTALCLYWPYVGRASEPAWRRAVLPGVSEGGRVGDVVFVDDRFGWCLENDRHVYATEDGGERWVRRYSAPEGTQLSSVSFSGRGEGWAVGGQEGRPIALRTRDGGLSWTVGHGGLQGGSGGWTRVWADGESAIAIGQIRLEGDYEAVIAQLTSDDRGRILYRGGKRHGAFWDLRYSASGARWAVGPGIVVGSTDQGVNWKIRHMDANDLGLGSVATAGNSTVWVAGGWNKLMKSVDGGITWRRVASEHFRTELFFSQVVFADARRGWVAGDRGMAYRTEDGGESWKLERIGGAGVVRRLWAQRKRVWAATDEGLFVRVEETR